MAKWIKLTYMRGEVFVLKRINMVLNALLRSWHADYVLAGIAVLSGCASLVFVGIALWVFAGGIAALLHGDLTRAWTLLMYALVVMFGAKMAVSFALWLLPLDKVEKQADDE